MKNYLLILFLVINIAFLKAQIDTSSYQTLEVIDVYTSYQNGLNTGSAIIAFDSSVLAQNKNVSLAELFSNEGGAFIKSYGLGNLATSSVRGAGANHTKVLWNGFDVSNPMLGQVDFSYLNVNSFDDISIQFGNTNGTYGSGTQGGVIRLDNSLQFTNSDKINLGLNTGSFGLFTKTVDYTTSTDKVASSIHFNQRNATNNFSYLDDDISFKRENADVRSIGVNFTNAIKIKQYQKLTTNIWYQNNDRGIPAGIGVSNKNERLANEFLRSSVKWNRYGEKHDYQISGAYFEEQLNYSNPVSFINDNTRFKKWIGEAEFKKRINEDGELIVGTNLSSIQSYSVNYSDVASRLSNAYFIGYNKPFLDKKLLVTPSIRKEFVSDFHVPFTGSFGIEYALSDKIKLVGSASKNYRLPTFNDLYFSNQGNPELLPEEGWSSELSTKFSTLKSIFRVTGFYNNYTNWISWKPQSNGFWQPQNNDVITKGLEFYETVKLEKYFIRLSASYTQSIDAETGYQLIYVPLFTASTTVGYNYKGLLVSYNHQYVEERFISTNNAYSLPYYYLGSLKVSKQVVIKESLVNIGVEVNNIFNTTYQAVVNQPMPGRYFGLNFSIVFNNKNNKNDQKLS